MIEVEIKVRIADPGLMRKKFEEKGGSFQFSLLHEDTYFNMPKDLRNFATTDEALRLRKSVEFKPSNENVKQKINYYLTYKGKKLDTSTKTREEIDLSIESLEKMRRILKILGFQEIMTVRKERELYNFDFRDYNILALIDFLPILNQYFIEVEYLADSKDQIEVSQEILFDFLHNFEIQKKDSIKESYLELVMDKINDV
ncbi:hypothetical protein LCGC14_0506210 [marine sediment metagenome]|uniref:CYTH domain-containing protein n=1 Tax=marine sediment metagenome TaxID=412755 RepID=A0A0F9SKW5_9ZZZZ|nr:MAG: CYTH domain protein [Candidatus Lokiarchaeum sp. GC14_75]